MPQPMSFYNQMYLKAHTVKMRFPLLTASRGKTPGGHVRFQNSLRHSIVSNSIKDRHINVAAPENIVDSQEVDILIADAGIDLETSGLRYLSTDAKVGGAVRHIVPFCIIPATLVLRQPTVVATV
jgi:hypothetical protein